ncbi:MAG: tRNA epoxyqueuosine(34) reductase QueG [Acidimicrobiales bacterium]
MGLDRALAEEVCSVGLQRGLDAIGIAPAGVFDRTRRDLHQRKAEGLHGGMAFTYRNPDRSTDPSRAVAGARALIVGARRYPADPVAPAGANPAEPTARVARYATEDHYRPLRAALSEVAERLRHHGWRALVVADDNALVDREAARRAGLGWYGKNTNVLLPGRGSWFVLGSVVTDAPLPAAEQPVADGCGACRRCLAGCPTGALVAPGVLDARRCLAWLLQAPGWFPSELRSAVGDRIYGCDDCQEVCPENRVAALPAGAGAGTIGGATTTSPTTASATTASATTASAEGGDDGAGESKAAVEGLGATVPVLAVLGASDDELLARFGRWYIAERQPRYLRRNALLVLGNTADGRAPGVEIMLGRYLQDPDPMLRGHAVWAAARLGRHDLLVSFDGEEDSQVRAELEQAAADLT